MGASFCPLLCLWDQLSPLPPHSLVWPFIGRFLENLNLLFNVLYTLSGILSTKKGRFDVHFSFCHTPKRARTAPFTSFSPAPGPGSRLIHLVTSDFHAHASIGLRTCLRAFYSFARKYESTSRPLPMRPGPEERPSVRNQRIPCYLS